MKIDGDKAKDLCREYKIDGYPAVLIFQRGNLEKLLIGHHDEDIYKSAINAAIALHGNDKNQLGDRK